MLPQEPKENGRVHILGKRNGTWQQSNIRIMLSLKIDIDNSISATETNF